MNDPVANMLDARSAALAEVAELRRLAGDMEAEIGFVDQWLAARGCPVAL